ncbi:MAG: hypothetical protein WDA75_02030 [Candidatus Latescibacterota bacterium]|jgi:hypothetical protein
MPNCVLATYDGSVLHLDEDLRLSPNTRVRVTVEALEPPAVGTRSFLRTARALELHGPIDWSERLARNLSPTASPLP